MKLKNFTRDTIRVTARIGGHVIRFKSGEERSVPQHLEEDAIRAGLVPLDDIIDIAEREAELASVIQSHKDAEAKAEVEAATEQTKALEEAAKKAKASEAAKKSAATRAANAATKASE
ncbi:hypothetical protein [Pseudoalteromonas sp. SWYJZ19]|uniref:hypothetical protein n=1 Tax=Pseudoalteromonas sp. SWYJZ19 TaxID=2792068 RepID=UPI0018CCB75F|nr:hypothetical protein [Pseudoalteromonas sp. SWYJZ19]MBH0050711.1 hypothetical protein [Pseudoalteromonas sp. SWYJZ19]